jgi:hypothetical protein
VLSSLKIPLVVMFDPTSFNKVNLILLQTMVIVILEGDKIWKNCAELDEAVRYIN